MKILAVSDRVVDSIYSSHIRKRFGDVDMVVSCGDLPYSYLEYIVSMLNVPCFYVHGNHDGHEYLSDGRTLTEPSGWVNLDGHTVRSKELLLGGLEGSIRYRPGAPYQYTEREMSFRVWGMTPELLLNRVFTGRFLDIFVAHAPPFGIHDAKDWPHRGFKAFLEMMARFRPRYLLHGHKHVYALESCHTHYLGTEVINVYPYRVIEFDT